MQENSKQLLTKALILIVGLIFIISAYLKLLDINSFATIISSYGFGRLSIVAPLIVIAETIIGLQLIFFVKVKSNLIASLLLFAFFTVVYSYGFFVKEIESCGCFGNKLNEFFDKPVVLYIRNSILILISYIAYKYHQQNEVDNEIKLKKVVISIIVALVIFISGSFFSLSSLKSHVGQIKFSNKSVNVIGFDELYNFSDDSTYIAFIYSYSCPHCLNTIANINLYKDFNYVDNVVHLAIGDSIHKEIFNKNYLLRGSIVTGKTEVIKKIFKAYPTILFIKNNTVIYEQVGPIQAPLVFFKENKYLTKQLKL